MRLPGNGTLGTWLATAGNNQAYRADLYEFTMKNGDILRWTSADAAITYKTYTWNTVPTAPILKRGKLRLVAGIEVDSMDLDMIAGDSYLLPNGKSLQVSATDGYFDAAKVILYHLIMPTWGDLSLMTSDLILYSGYIAEIEPNALGVKFRVKSLLDWMNMELPRRIFSPLCQYELFSPACGVSTSGGSGASAYSRTGTVASGSTAKVVNVSTPAWTPPSMATYDLQHFFQYGSFINNTTGVLRMINSATTSSGVTTCTLNVPLPTVPTIGDSITLRRYCSKTLTFCGTFTGGQFGGFPEMPRPENAAVAVPAKTEFF